MRDLGVYMDSELTMKEHVAKIAAACFHHIRLLRQIRRRVGQEVTQQQMCGEVTSRICRHNTIAILWA